MQYNQCPVQRPYDLLALGGQVWDREVGLGGGGGGEGVDRRPFWWVRAGDFQVRVISGACPAMGCEGEIAHRSLMQESLDSFCFPLFFGHV